MRQLTGSVEGGRPSTHLVYRAATETSPELFQPEAGMAEELAAFDRAERWA